MKICDSSTSMGIVLILGFSDNMPSEISIIV